MRGLRLGLGFQRGRSGPVAPYSISIGSGEVITGSLLTANITGLLGGEVITYQWQDDGVNIAGRTSSTYTVAIGTDAVADASQIRVVVTIDGVPYTSNSRQVRYAAGSFGALTNQSFTDDTGLRSYVFPAATGANLTWTYDLTSPPADVTIDGPSREIFFDTDALSVQSGTVITVTAVDQYGRAATGSPRTFTLTITVNNAVNPDFTNLTFADPDPGVPDELTATYTYAGADDLIFRGITSTSATAPGATRDEELNNIRNGTGSGTLEEFAVNPFSVANFDLTGLTSASESATYIHAFIEEANNGGASSVRTTAVSGLDFTAPTFASGVPADNATGVAVGANLVLTFSEAVFAGTGVFTLRNVTAGTTVETFNIATGVGSAGGTISVSGTDVTINPFADLLNSTDYAVRWDAGTLLDGDGNALAANTGDTLYNFTTASGAVDTTVVRTAVLAGGSNSITLTAVDFGAAAAGLEALIVFTGSFSTAPLAGQWTATVGGNAATELRFIGPDRGCITYILAITIPAGGVLDVVLTGPGGFTLGHGTVMCLRVLGRNGIETAVTQGSFTNNALLTASQPVADGSTVIAGFGARGPLAANGATVGLTWVGVTQQIVATANTPPQPIVSLALATNVPAGTRTITAQPSGETFAVGKTAFSIELTA